MQVEYLKPKLSDFYIWSARIVIPAKAGIQGKTYNTGFLFSQEWRIIISLIGWPCVFSENIWFTICRCIFT